MKPLLLLIALLVSVCAHASTDYEWPGTVVRIEDMAPQTRMRLSVPKVRMQGDLKGPAVMRVHVDQDGLVRRVALIEGSGSPAHDEAAMHAMREMRFSPKLVNGQPSDVSLVVPIHFPKQKYPYRTLEP